MFALKAVKAIADETRLRLATVLSRYELSVNEIVSLMDMGQSRISRHLKILVDADLLESRRDGLWVYYTTVPSGEGRAFIDAMLPFALDMPTTRADLDMAMRILEERNQKVRELCNPVTEDWDALQTEILGDFDLPSAVLEKMPIPCKVAVDLGCGRGGVLEILRQKADSIIGVDGSSRVLEIARRRFAETQGTASHSVSLRIGELDHLPLRDFEVDFACINLVLHHISDPKLVLIEIQRILQHNGTLLVTEFIKHNDESLRTDYGDRWLGFDEQNFIQMAQSVGFIYDNIQRVKVKKDLSLFLLTLKKQ